MKTNNTNGVTTLGGRCCDIKAAAKRNAGKMKEHGKEKKEYLNKKYKSYSDLLA